MDLTLNFSILIMYDGGREVQHR